MSKMSKKKLRRMQKRARKVVTSAAPIFGGVLVGLGAGLALAASRSAVVTDLRDAASRAGHRIRQVVTRSNGAMAAEPS